MLVTTTHNLNSLDEHESLAKSREDTRQIQQARGLFMDGQQELENKELAAGKRIHWKEFLRLLEKAAPSLLIREGSPGNMAIYRRKRADEPVTHTPGAAEWYDDHAYVTGFAQDWLTEFSSVTTTDRGVANREQRGWRTVLVHLIQQRALTYRDAVRHFGEPTGARSWRWFNELQNNKG